MKRTSTVITEDLKKFVRSEYAERILQAARLNGKEEMKYGKLTYSISFLLNLIKSNV